MITKKNVFSAAFKIIVPLYTTYILFILSVFLVFVPMMKKNMMAQKKNMIQELTDSTWSLLSEYNQRVKLGELTIYDAKQQAIDQIRILRYGPEGKDYFWIINMQNRVIMHPYVPDLEGMDQTYVKDSSGKQLWVAMVDKVKEQGSGYIEYRWQWKDNPEQIVPKISFVKGFTPWDWVIGTGIYIEDIHQEIGLIIQEFVKIFAGILAIVILMSFYIVWQAVKIEGKRSLAEKAKQFEELRLKKLLELSQMSDATMNTLTGFALEEAIQLTQSDVGYLAFLNEDETQLTMHTWSNQAMKKNELADKKLIFQVEETGIWGDAIRRREAVIINNYENYKSLKKKGYPKGHIKIFRVMNIPIFDSGKIVALAGVGNKLSNYNESDVRQLTLMMDGMWRIIQKKNSEDDLRRSEERYRLLADNATDTIWILQLSDFSFSYMSPSVKQLLGYTPEDCFELKFGQLMTKESVKEISDVISEGVGRDDEIGIDAKQYRLLELELIKKSGLKIWTEVTASFLRDKNGKPDRILGVTRNITERRQLEKKLLQAHKMEAIGTLAGGIAHDFNNILSSVLGFTDLVKIQIKGNEEATKNLDQVLAAGIRARDLVKHILTFSRRADVQMDLIEITPLIKECLKFLRASIPRNIEIKKYFDVKKSIILADPTQIHQVLMNLFTNAAYAMKDTAGVLEVRMESIDIQSGEIIQTKELKQGRYLQLTISDTGCGIPKEVIPRIFEPFFTTKGRAEGTGMGLSTAYGIIKEMDGTITVYSEPGIGTTFQVMLPEHEGEPDTGKASVDSPLKKGNGRILIVDDEPSIISFTSQVLLSLGYEVVSTTESPEALKKFKLNPNGFDLVLTDLEMPQISGLELVKQVKEIRSDIPIVLCTGFSDGLTDEKIQTLGISDMVMKPMIASELAQVVANLLDDKRRLE